jgi:hypothetical protein
MCTSIRAVYFEYIIISGKETRFFRVVFEPRPLSRSGEKSKEIAELNTQLLNRYSTIYDHILSIFYVSIFGGLQSVGVSFAYAAHLGFLRDVWIRN